MRLTAHCPVYQLVPTSSGCVQARRRVRRALPLGLRQHRASQEPVLQMRLAPKARASRTQQCRPAGRDTPPAARQTVPLREPARPRFLRSCPSLPNLPLPTTLPRGQASALCASRRSPGFASLAAVGLSTPPRATLPRRLRVGLQAAQARRVRRAHCRHEHVPSGAQRRRAITTELHSAASNKPRERIKPAALGKNSHVPFKGREVLRRKAKCRLGWPVWSSQSIRCAAIAWIPRPSYLSGC
jgi:hypothetical protein